jgi:uroporphyrinogen-III synthase
MKTPIILLACPQHKKEELQNLFKANLADSASVTVLPLTLLEEQIPDEQTCYELIQEADFFVVSSSFAATTFLKLLQVSNKASLWGKTIYAVGESVAKIFREQASNKTFDYKLRFAKQATLNEAMNDLAVYVKNDLNLAKAKLVFVCGDKSLSKTLPATEPFDFSYLELYKTKPIKLTPNDLPSALFDPKRQKIICFTSPEIARSFYAQAFDFGQIHLNCKLACIGSSTQKILIQIVEYQKEFQEMHKKTFVADEFNYAGLLRLCKRLLEL